MGKILMSIQPVYAKQIFDGNKTFEYRKNRCKRTDVTTIVIYVTSPIMKVLGEVEVLDIIEDSPHAIWQNTSYGGGIDKTSYDMYFAGRNKAVAYHLGKVTRYSQEKTLKDFNIHYYPQSYVYLDKRNEN